MPRSQPTFCIIDELVHQGFATFAYQDGHHQLGVEPNYEFLETYCVV